MSYKLQGDTGKPVLVFSNSLGTEMMMWDDLIPYLLPYFQILQYDTRGHGLASKPKGAYLVEHLAEDLIQLMDSLAINKAYFCGLSMGGLIGQCLGIKHARRFHKLVFSNSGAKVADDDYWNNRIKTIQEKGMQALVKRTDEVWFTDKFKNTEKQKAADFKAMFLRADIDGHCSCCAAIRDADFSAELKKIELETLIIAGNEDPATTLAHADFLVESIPNSSLIVLPARHLAASELPKQFSEILINFFIN